MKWTWLDRKAARTEHFYRFVFGWRLQRCGACNGSGHYDHDGSPPCGGCDGTGKERARGPLTMDRAAVDAQVQRVLQRGRRSASP